MGLVAQTHVRQDDLDTMLKQANAPESKKDIRTQPHLMERSYARSTRYGFKRAPWRWLWRVQIQEYLTSCIQNIPDPALEMVQARPGHQRAYLKLQDIFIYFKK